MNDIRFRGDIDILVTTFYEALMQDNLLKHFFTQVIELDLKEHLPVIVDFWESILLGNMVYRGNPMIKHIELNKKSKISAAHFDRWLSHWELTIDAHFQGPIAEEAKKRAKLMGDLMQFKIKQSESPDGARFIQ